MRSSVNNEIAVSHFIDRVSEELCLPDKIRIFDTTLRDGEQTPGVSLTVEEKLRIASALNELGVDAIEAGFPITSKGESKSIKKIADQGFDLEICGLARAHKKDIDAAIDCNVDSVHTFIATSEIHMKHKLKFTKEQVIEKAVEAVDYAKGRGVLVEFSAEDATRSDIKFLDAVHAAVQDAGVDRINVPDTVGVMIPRAMFWLIKELKKTAKVPLSAHCHNDFGLAVPNTFAAIEAGCEQAHVTINGLGERAGNASLEEVVMGLKALYKCETEIKTEKLFETSELVSRLTSIPIQPNKAIVGANAFSHESGIHVHGVLGEVHTYEPMLPEMVGHRRRIVLGKHTGLHAIKSKLDAMNIEINDEQLSNIVEQVKKLGDWGKTITEADLRAIAEATLGKVAGDGRRIELEELTVMTGNKITPTASVKVKIGNDIKIGSSTGVGPVDAAIRAIQMILSKMERLELEEYRLDAITGGSNALAEVTVKLKDEKSQLYVGRGVSPDIVMASVSAMIEGLNRAALSKTD